MSNECYRAAFIDSMITGVAENPRMIPICFCVGNSSVPGATGKRRVAG